jgi:type IV pilus assembly protein PilA
MAANEAAAVGSVRTLDTAQISYSVAYPQRGYAPDLASLGPDPDGRPESPAHAGWVDASLADSTCTAGNWCMKSGYRFSIASICKMRKCSEYVVLATPVSDSTGTRSFCSTSDGIVRFKTGPPLTSMIRASECRAWPPMQ